MGCDTRLDKTNVIFNLFSYLPLILTGLAFSVFWDGPFIHAMIIILISCCARIISKDKIWTTIICAITIVAILPSMLFVLIDQSHLILIAAGLSNIIPMLLYVIKGKTKLYESFYK